jgi:hypothetical protein
MTRHTQFDLFRPTAVQPDLFEDGAAAPAPVYTPDPDGVRMIVHRLLDTARAADLLPWTEREARTHRTVFPQMCNWLPEREADALRAAFATELRRLGLE